MNTIDEIIETIGVPELAAAVGSAKTAVYNARKSGAFPARWYQIVDAMCQSRGLECPMDLFNFVRPAGDESALALDLEAVG